MTSNFVSLEAQTPRMHNNKLFDSRTTGRQQPHQPKQKTGRVRARATPPSKNQSTKAPRKARQVTGRRSAGPRILPRGRGGRQPLAPGRSGGSGAPPGSKCLPKSSHAFLFSFPRGADARRTPSTRGPLSPGVPPGQKRNKSLIPRNILRPPAYREHLLMGPKTSLLGSPPLRRTSAKTDLYNPHAEELALCPNVAGIFAGQERAAL